MHQPQPDADGLDFRNQQGSGECTTHRAHAADHDDDEYRSNDQQIHFQAGRFAWQLQCPAQPRQKGTEGKNAGKQPSLIDPERGDHFTILRRGTHQHAPAGALQQQPQEPEHQRPDADQEEIIGRKFAPQNADRTRQPRRSRPEQIFRAPQPQRGVLDDQHQRKGGKQLEKLRSAINPPQQQHFHQRTEQADRQRRQ